MKVARRLGVVFEGLPERQNEIVDGPRGRQHVVPPHQLKDVLPADHLTLSADEELQEHALPLGQLADRALA